ncbi:MAG: hypothetical protein QGG67_02725 [Gammaproteobacteria bacterium]|nr:hypothetical protein [Gammaproteobacteria bacterium]HJO10726.1 hypothetical protein [Gammaproteobacteria bacterium]
MALVATVAHRPDLLILDEPSSGLDAVVRQDILNAIVRTISEEGRTVIFSSHLLEEVERMSDHVVMIQQGQVVLDGVLETLCNSYRHVSIRFADQFDSAPVLRDVLYINGNGRSWSAIHHISEEQFNTAVKQLDGEVVESRNATLEEIFIARVGRSIDKQEAA